MALVPYSITALAESDADGTSGKNIVAGAVVQFYNAASGGTAQTLYDNAASANPSTSKTTDSQGQVTIYIEQGAYWITINGGTRRAVTISDPDTVVSALVNKNISVLAAGIGGSPQGSQALTVFGSGTTSATSAVVTVDSSSAVTHFMRDDGSAYHKGNLGVGLTPSPTKTVAIKGASTNTCFEVQNSVSFGMLYTGTASQTMAAGANVSDSALFLSRDSTTSRSVNAAGTINASGADYAEYEEKANSDDIAKGDVIGFNLNGKVTNKFSESISFAIKSTDPAYVGGDSWATTPKPKPIEPNTIEYTGIAKPEPILDEKGNDTQDYTQWKLDQSEYEQLILEEESRVRLLNDEAYAEWKPQHEAERATVDRIAYCGKVPVNNAPACNVGDYLIAIEGDADSIALEVKTKAQMTFSDWADSIGRVKSFGEDGRPIVIVKVV